MPDRIIVSAPGPQGPAGSGGGGSISDGDKGDITVSGVGTVWTVDAGAINTTKLGGDITTAGKALLDDADAAAQRTTLGLGSAATQPSTNFATSNHNHVAADITSQPASSLVARPEGTGGACSAVTLGTGLQFNGTTLETTNLAGSTTQMIAGTGLTGGGTLAADRTFNVAYGTSAGTACEGDDARLSDARTPTAHTHAPSDIQQAGAVTGEVLKWNGSAWAPGTDNTSGGGGGAPTNAQYFTLTADATLSDERVLTFGTGLTATDGGAGAQYDVEVDYGTTQNTACEGNDARLSDARTPTAHTHALSDITQSSATSGQVPTWNGSAWAPATPSSGGGVDPSTTAFEFDDFAVQGVGYVLTVSGGQALYSTFGADPGALVLDTSAGGNANARALLVSSNGLATFDLQQNTEYDLSASAALNTNSVVYTGHVRLGYGDSQNQNLPTDGVYFRSVAVGNAGSNWFAITVNGGTETATDTGVAQNTTDKRFRIVVSTVSSVRTARFYIDGTLVATHTTNLPTTTVGWHYAAVRTGTETVAKQMYVLWHRHEITRATALSFT